MTVFSPNNKHVECLVNDRSFLRRYVNLCICKQQASSYQSKISYEEKKNTPKFLFKTKMTDDWLTQLEETVKEKIRIFFSQLDISHFHFSINSWQQLLQPFII